MFGNFLLIAVVIMAMWTGVLVYYLAISRQQGSLQDSLEELREILDGADDRGS